MLPALRRTSGLSVIGWSSLSASEAQRPSSYRPAPCCGTRRPRWRSLTAPRRESRHGRICSQGCPRTPEALSARVELYYSIGYLRWAAGDLERAAGALQSGLDLAADHPLPELKSRLLNGLGIVHYDSRQVRGRHWRPSSRVCSSVPSSVSLLINLGATCGMLGRKQEATASQRKPLPPARRTRRAWSGLDTSWPAWESLTKRSRICSRQSNLRPRVSRYRAALAVLYSVVDRADEARPQLESARLLAGASAGRYLDVLQAAILGDAEKARALTQGRGGFERDGRPRYPARSKPGHPAGCGPACRVFRMIATPGRFWQRRRLCCMMHRVTR